MEGRRSVGAATIAEAFRLTVEDDADRIAVRTKDDEIDHAVTLILEAL